jgi:NitT/TauT family transport system permease protein
MFAALLSLAALGVFGSHLVQMVHRRLVFWDTPASETIVTE